MNNPHRQPGALCGSSSPLSPIELACEQRFCCGW